MITDRLFTYIAGAACLVLSIALFFTHGALQAQKLKYSALETTVETERKVTAQAYAEGLNELRTEQTAITDKYQGALNDARTRDATSRRHAELAHTESSGLRSQLVSAARRIADTHTPTASVAEYATAVGELLADCSRERQGFADKAEGHANDVRTLISAWPVSP